MKNATTRAWSRGFVEGCLFASVIVCGVAVLAKLVLG